MYSLLGCDLVFRFMMMRCEGYARGVLHVVAAQICHSMGWNSIHPSCLEVLADILERRLCQLSIVSHQFSEHAERTQPNLDDLAHCFDHLGVRVKDLEMFTKNIDPVPFAHDTVAFPTTKSVNCTRPDQSGCDVFRDGCEQIDDSLVAVLATTEDKKLNRNSPSPLSGKQEFSDDVKESKDHQPELTVKRSAPSHAESVPVSKRSRLLAFDFPNEANRSRYEMSSIVQTPVGSISFSRRMPIAADCRRPAAPMRQRARMLEPVADAALAKARSGFDTDKENAVVMAGSSCESIRLNLSVKKNGSAVLCGMEDAVDGHLRQTAGELGMGSEVENVKSRSKYPSKGCAVASSGEPKCDNHDYMPPNHKISMPKGARKKLTVSSLVKKEKKKVIRRKKNKEMLAMCPSSKSSSASSTVVVPVNPTESRDHPMLATGDSSLSSTHMALSRQSDTGTGKSGNPVHSSVAPKLDTNVDSVLRTSDEFTGLAAVSHVTGKVADLCALDNTSSLRKRGRPKKFKSRNKSSLLVPEHIIKHEKEDDDGDTVFQKDTSNDNLSFCEDLNPLDINVVDSLSPESVADRDNKVKPSRLSMPCTDGRQSTFRDDVKIEPALLGKAVRSSLPCDEQLSRKDNRLKLHHFSHGDLTSISLQTPSFGNPSSAECCIATAAAAASSLTPSTSSTFSKMSDFPSPISLEEERVKEKKSKKNDRHDKERRKKSKDRSHDKGKHRHWKLKCKDEMVTGKPSGFKLKIKIGRSKEVKSVAHPENALAMGSSSRSVSVSPSHRELKMVIRRDAHETCGARSQSLMPESFTAQEVHNTPPTHQPTSPVSKTPPPLVLSRSTSPTFDCVFRRQSVTSSPCADEASEKMQASLRDIVKRLEQDSPSHNGPVSPLPNTPSPPFSKFPFHVLKMSSPHKCQSPNSVCSFSSAPHNSPIALREKSFSPTPKTPSLSPNRTTPHRTPSPIAVKLCSPCPSPPCSSWKMFPEINTILPDEQRTAVSCGLNHPVRPSIKTTPTKPRSKVGRPKSTSPICSKQKSPKTVMLPENSDTAPRPTTSIPTKSPGRGRPPKSKLMTITAASDTVNTAQVAAGFQDTVTKGYARVSQIVKDGGEQKSRELFAPLMGIDSSDECLPPSSSSVDMTSTRKSLASVEVETAGSFFDPTTGQQVWICPTCKMQDDGSPMIGCDKCDDWYHWVCVSITCEPPEEQLWFCSRCAKAQHLKPKGKRGRKRKIS